MTYLRNSWYLAAWQDEIPGSGTVVRVILGDPVVLFRNENGEAKALLDRCPHRFAPLSSGGVADGILACAYHGLAFDGTGACVVNPHGRSEEHTSELQSLMRISYAVFCLKKKKNNTHKS